MKSLWTRELFKTGPRVVLPAVVALLIVLPLWLSEWAALAQPAGMRGTLRALGVLAGVAGGALWVTSLLLMLRFPGLDRRFGGLEQQYFTHHFTGTLAYLMLLAHPLLLAAAAWLTSPAAGAAMAAPWAQPLSVVVGWLALVGLMAMMSATFFTRMPYQRWKQWHAASAIAYVFALVHVVWLAPPAGAGGYQHYGAWLLIALMGAGVAAITLRHLLNRGVLAARPFAVEQVTRVSPSTVEATLALRDDAAPLAYAPGEFVFVAFEAGPRYAGCREYHPFTISSAPGLVPGPVQGRFKLLIKALGDCTSRMQHLVPGVGARVQGPYGGLFQEADFSRKQLWLGGGIGVTPFLAMAQALPADAAGVDFYYLARDAADAPGLAALQARSVKASRLQLYPFLADESPQAVFVVMQAKSAPLAERDIYICGPPGMLHGWLTLLAQAGVPDAQIHAERFDFR